VGGVTLPKRTTLPTSPWDDKWHHDPSFSVPKVAPPHLQKDVHKRQGKLVDKPPLTPVSARMPLDIMATRCFTGNLNASDLKYMALAVLQMQDELFELRERVRLLEGDLPPGE
jgi:hypothetical protein